MASPAFSANVWQFLLVFSCYLLVFIAAAVTVMFIERYLFFTGNCFDFYLAPLRILERKKRRRLQKMLDDICEEIRYPEKPTVDIYFSRGLICGPEWAYCHIPAGRIFMQNWLLKNADENMIKFVLCHELGHIVAGLGTTSFEDEYDADAFGAMIMGKNAGIAALNKMWELVMKKSSLPPDAKLPDELIPAYIEIDMRIRRLSQKAG